ncbi:helix-turn-helix domain-containing protein [Clostridium magnum]|uniref:Transposase n=1 Tax=Clostridium magnum DSM 2767 TaxID=1121326 RepID=A0A162TL98_9CLOT|nr:helix-turn-helix domain-containing protein [Clostridium magnum]KZL92787.1 transposase [Clostridium magnum DSM 2767]SHJ40560.1 Transposase [Clostridium magnum DSM 2767]
MPKRTKYTAEEKYKILMAYENGLGSMLKVDSMYKIREDNLRNLIYNFEKYGLYVLRESRTWKSYSTELKTQAVMDYLSGEYSLREVVNKYELSDKSLLKHWINKYNSHREIRTTLKGMSQSMTKGRITSLKER